MATIKNAIENLIGNEEEKRKQRELLTLLAEASESRATLMVNELKTYIRTAGTDENKSIPVTDILSDFLEVRVTTSGSMGDIVKKVSESIKKMMAGNILEGVTSLIGDTLKDIVGSSSGAEVTRKQYFVGVEGLSMVRYDVSYWSREITIESIKKSAEKSLICVMTKSSIDVPKLKFNTFLNIYQSLLEKNSGMTIDELITHIKEAKRVYKVLMGDDENTTIETVIIDDLNDVKIEKIDDLVKYLTVSSESSIPKSEWPILPKVFN